METFAKVTSFLDVFMNEKKGIYSLLQKKEDIIG